MIKVACLSFNNTFIKDLTHPKLNIDYFESISKIDYSFYDFVIILNDFGRVDVIKCLRYIKEYFNGIIYIIDYQYNSTILKDSFKYGASDYFFLPLKFEYLVYKMLNEYSITLHTPNNDYCLNGLRIDFNSLQVYLNTKKIILTKLEYHLLEYLILNKNHPVSKKQIYQQVWKGELDDYRTIETHIKTLRQKLNNYKIHIVTIWNFGYAFMEEIE